MKKLTIAMIVLIAFLVLFSGITFGQAPAATAGATGMETSQSLGMGMESRFNSGVTPITIERINIVPGTPLVVKPTMDNMTGTGAGSFGGILSRYDKSTFGKFFAAGSLDAQTTISRSKLDNVSLGDNLIDNSDSTIARMYPPRLFIEATDFPITTVPTEQIKKNVASQLNNVLSRYDLDPALERVELLFQDGLLILQGQIRSKDRSETLANVLSMEPGIQQVENRLIVLQ